MLLITSKPTLDVKRTMEMHDEPVAAALLKIGGMPIGRVMWRNKQRIFVRSDGSYGNYKQSRITGR